MNDVYRIKDWDEHFEIAQSRQYKTLSWIALPNKHDGKGFRRIAMHERATDIFAAWILILQVASKCKTRGTLIDNKEPITSEDLSIKTGFKKEAFDIALEVLTSKKIEWIEKITISEATADRQQEDSD